MVSAPPSIVLGWRYRRYRSVGPCQVLVGSQSKGLISRPICRSSTTLLRGVTNTQLHPWITSNFGRIWAGFDISSTAGCLVQRSSQLANLLTFLKTSSTQACLRNPPLIRYISLSLGSTILLRGMKIAWQPLQPLFFCIHYMIIHGNSYY